MMKRNVRLGVHNHSDVLDFSLQYPSTDDVFLGGFLLSYYYTHECTRCMWWKCFDIDILIDTLFCIWTGDWVEEMSCDE
jgi:hypothetical protein